MSEDNSLLVPLLGGTPGSSTESLDTAETPPKPKPQHPSPLLEPLQNVDTEQLADRDAVATTPDGSIVPVSSTASLPSGRGRTNERPLHDATPGSAPSGRPYHPQTYGGATPGPPLTPPIPGPASDHTPQKPDMPVPGLAPERHSQQMYPAAQRAPQYPPPQPQFPRLQYQPHRPLPAVQHTIPGRTSPNRKPFKTSKTLDCSNVCENQYYVSIFLCITLTLFCNPLAIICCIPAFCFASKAAKENVNDNYDKALSLENKALILNIGGFILLVTYGIIFLVCGVFGGVSVAAYFNA